MVTTLTDTKDGYKRKRFVSTISADISRLTLTAAAFLLSPLGRCSRLPGAGGWKNTRYLFRYWPDRRSAWVLTKVCTKALKGILWSNNVTWCRGTGVAIVLLRQHRRRTVSSELFMWNRDIQRVTLDRNKPQFYRFNCRVPSRSVPPRRHGRY